MKTTYKILLILSCFFLSCEDFLDETPKSLKTIVGISLLDAQESVNGIYAFLRAPYDKTGYAKMAYSSLEVSTGFLKPALGTQDTDMEDAYRLIYSSSSANAELLWSTYYKGIEAANVAIASIPNITDPELTANIAKSLLGEAYFLRAYYYFQLVQIFGDIPLNTTPSSSLQDGTLSKSTVNEVYETLIVPDLIEAESAGLPNNSTSGRVTLGAVKSLLAKVYLTMAGNPLNQTEKYSLAKDKANEVINSSEYSLFQTDSSSTWFDKLSDPVNDNLGENIFMVQYASNGVTSSFTNYFTPLGGEAITDQNLHFGGMEPEVDFINSYDSADLRGQNQGFFFNELDGITFNNSLYKFFYDGYRTANGVSNKDFPLIRYADVLLTYAEAQNQSGSADATAYEALNAVRSRAGLTDVSGLSNSEFREEVLKQRVLEFPAEAGLIWFDMRRTMKAFNGTGFNDFVGHTLPNGKTLSADHIYFPIPQSEVVLNPNLGD
jgi:hypothetical protein